MCAGTVIELLVRLFNRFFVSGVAPIDWLTMHVYYSLGKGKGDKYDVLIQ